MSTTMTAETRSERDSDSRNTTARHGSLIGLGYDLLFVCNLYWPLLVLAFFFGETRTYESVQFWQVFFVTTPHRWITLFLVFGDTKKLARQSWLFVSITLLVVGTVSLVWLSVGSLLCLLTIDYIWNAWHFAAQHHGIYRIYSRSSSRSGAMALSLERWMFRGFIIYVIARVAGWSWELTTLTEWACQLDLPVLVLPVVLVLGQLIQKQTANRYGLIYSTSVLTLFSCMLLAVHYEMGSLVLQLALASALFHATEYLAVVTWSMQSEKTLERQDLFGRMASQWLLYLAAFAGVLGASSWIFSTSGFKIWVALNLMAAFLHYSFDGVIWKRPRKTTSTTGTA